MDTHFALKNMRYFKDGILCLKRFEFEVTDHGIEHVLSQIKRQSVSVWRDINQGRGQRAKFQDDLWFCIYEKIQENRSDIDSVAFEFEGESFKLDGFIHPGNNGAHYRWIDLEPSMGS